MAWNEGFPTPEEVTAPETETEEAAPEVGEFADAPMAPQIDAEVVDQQIKAKKK